MTTTYATVLELKQGMNFPVEAVDDTSKDAAMQVCLDAASAVIDRVCNRPDGFVASVDTARTFHGSGKDYIFTRDCIAVSLVETRSSSSAAWETLTGWFEFSGDPLHPSSNSPYVGVIREGGVFTALRFPSVRITAQWGYSATVPDQVKQATIMQAARWFKRSESAWADATASAEMGTALYRKAMDPEIELILKHGRLKRPSL